jgi:hypothetical protein
VEDQSRESENISKKDKPSEDNKTEALSEHNFLCFDFQRFYQQKFYYFGY